MKLKIDKELWDELDLPYSYVARVHIGSRRWFEDYQVIFEYDGRHWSFKMGFGSTEMQEDESPLEYVDHFQAQEVELREVTVKKWLPVAD